MRDPFKITQPTCISFSGGRTSAYMLWRVLQANHGLPEHTLICFANTGKEAEATLRFVRECAERWCVPIHWLEYCDTPLGFTPVNFETVSRCGEPFEALIRKRRSLPNPVSRFCTIELKIRPMHKFIRQHGWQDWDQLIGIRAEEQRRAAKIRARGHSTESAHETMCMPLIDAGVTVHDVNRFWQTQAFNLELLTVNGRPLEGNCDLCFLKPQRQRLALIRANPKSADWWIAMEALELASRPSGARFRNDSPTYAEMASFLVNQGDLFDSGEAATSCFCGD
ncbi:phosphoadenosine phosphosulfate reductase family protein [Pseudomonas sp. RC4D1]|uniref:phosphoadenosine phosphosulfate reductase domain-containing protein n=1 Tax=Pseudomonas sp. RC4D1 TaxID=2834407 RepID=UPI001BD0E020|nr:phosphoadenosine phosphosulfate reductase family protein [Pseudomonas sp. RC4D1]MBS7560137.1 phosphoadenosine phosphosulfate reductase family protein [Pseudomonas sp. RC4D1]